MSVERVFYCDTEDCKIHVRTPGTRPPTFLTVSEDSGDELHFCSWDCVLKFAAAKPPTETVPFEFG